MMMRWCWVEGLRIFFFSPNFSVMWLINFQNKKEKRKKIKPRSTENQQHQRQTHELPDLFPAKTKEKGLSLHKK